MDFWNSLGGLVTVELTCADPVCTLQTLSESGIVLRNVEFIHDLTIQCEIKRYDLTKLRKIADTRGDIFRICGKRGFYWTVRSMIKRPVLVLGLSLLLILVLYLPTRVLFVQVEGNHTIPSRRILAAAEECGIRFWSSRRQVRSEKVKNALLGTLPELTWAGVNTRGCVAVISVRERSQTEETEENRQIRSIVAAKDGIVESCTALEGNLLCRVGQAVKKGEVLISAYTDCGICIRVSSADGEIYARTRQEIDVIALSQFQKQEEKTDIKHKYSLLIGKKRINLWKGSGIWEGSCDRMYEEYYITLPGGYSLPIAFVQETFQFHITENVETESAELQESLKTYGRDYLMQQMLAGRILKGSELFRYGDDFCRMEGIYLCSEMIGRVQTEMIGE